MPSEEQLVPLLTSLVCRDPGLNPWPPVHWSRHSTYWDTGASFFGCRFLTVSFWSQRLNVAALHTLLTTSATCMQRCVGNCAYIDNFSALSALHIIPKYSLSYSIFPTPLCLPIIRTWRTGPNLSEYCRLWRHISHLSQLVVYKSGVRLWKILWRQF